MARKLTFALIALLATVPACCQIANLNQLPFEKLPPTEAIEKSLKESSLSASPKPFHAILAIGDPATPYSGKLEVWWQSSTLYKTVLTSPAFNQTRVVNGSQVQETNQGDYYPRWLQNFVDGILNPIPPNPDFSHTGGVVMLSEYSQRSCVSRNDKVNGITVDLTWGILCFAGSEPRLLSTLTVNSNLEFSDWQRFGHQQIPRTLTTDVLDYKPITAHLTTLEELKHPDSALFEIANPTPPAQQMQTAFVSTLKEESLVETVPEIHWPTVREGKTEGYMIVYARTDRTGQVRETAKHNSDQAGLESFGMQQALRYKFKPLVVDGIPVQMEMPLVLHFSTTIADPVPVLTGADLKNQISGCKITLTAAEAPPRDRIVRTRVSVNEQGKLTGEQFGPWTDTPTVARLTGDLQSCRFAPLLRDGVPTYYKGDLEVLR